jgi:reverse gyrase
VDDCIIEGQHHRFWEIFKLMKLLIVESPAKARKIKTFLGTDFAVEASVGHIREMPDRGLNIDIEGGFIPTFVIKDDKQDIVKKIKMLASQAEEIFLATDPDREGEAISWHIYDVLDTKSQRKVKRITYHEITKKAILDAVSKPREIDANLVSAAKARQVLDCSGKRDECWTCPVGSIKTNLRAPKGNRRLQINHLLLRGLFVEVPEWRVLG